MASLASPNVAVLLFDEMLKSECEAGKKIIDPVCQLLNVCQKADTSLAEAVHLWLSFRRELTDEQIGDIVEQRFLTSHILNTSSMAAYLLHPQYRGEHLSPEESETTKEFLIGKLTGKGIVSLSNYLKGNVAGLDCEGAGQQNILVTGWAGQ